MKAEEAHRIATQVRVDMGGIYSFIGAKAKGGATSVILAEHQLNSDQIKQLLKDGYEVTEGDMVVQVSWASPKTDYPAGR